ncbi:DUF2382 domain-containing protein [Mastigocoleus sp. MO_188.B34]|uniref:DUF2382 domain-containing protein n=1 Tax=Mastigocoleus sp. MO_188.B34 TaxID=3036635 RepID=UPI00262E4C02|nr:DUF2382 domain-containing protein [Mastigocoleus sp. MO_188.B34]MDJ0695884.1 DUF2382 domain-containing protein [Mastigocoleus sp. MO_188.B34]
MNSYNNSIITDKSKIKSVLIELDKQVISFNVVNLRGTIIAVVKNISTDEENNLCLLVSPLNNSGTNQLRLMSSDWVQQIGINKNILVVNLNKSDVVNLPVVNQSDIYTNSLISDIDNITSSKPVKNNTNKSLQESESKEVKVSLREERLLVKRERRKIGEVIIRKKVETHLVQVPIRREILIIEQIDSPNRQLTEIDLAESEVPGVIINTSDNEDVNFIVRGELISSEIASEVLREISLQQKDGCKKVSLEIEVESHQQQAKYQEIINRWIAK